MRTKIASHVKIDKNLIDKQKEFTDDLINKNRLSMRKPKLLSRRWYPIPGTLKIRFGHDAEDFIHNRITVIAEEFCIPLKEERRRRRKLRLTQR